jgi:hypothetical protein
MIERCERSELPVDMCAHCRGSEPVVRQHGTTVTKAVTAHLAATQARYEGWCGRCGGRVWVGQMIAPAYKLLPNGGQKTIWICEECATDE